MKKKKNRRGAKIRVMLVDDHAAMREALRMTINSEPDLVVMAEADSGHMALDLFSRTEPDVVLMDGSMPGMNGIETTRQLTQLHPAARIIGLTLYEEVTYLEEMIAAGARGYVSKTDAPASVAEAIRAVAAGHTYFDKAVPHRHSAATATSQIAQDQHLTEQLSANEFAVVQGVADGKSNAEIAADLELTLPVVERHRTAAMKKLNLRSRAELARVAALRHS